MARIDPGTGFPWQPGETFRFRVTADVNGPTILPATGDLAEEIAPNIEVGQWEDTQHDETSHFVLPGSPRPQRQVEDGRLVKLNTIPAERITRFKQRLERRRAIKNGQEALSTWIMDQDWIHRPEAIIRIIQAAKDMYDAENVDDQPKHIQSMSNLIAAVREISRKNG